MTIVHFQNIFNTPKRIFGDSKAVIAPYPAPPPLPQVPVTTDLLSVSMNLHSLDISWQPIPVLLPGKSHGWRSLVGCNPWGHEELDVTKRLYFHALEKEMATHSSVLVWKIPGTGVPGGLPSMGSHRVGHD